MCHNADPSDFPKCGKLDGMICGMGDCIHALLSMEGGAGGTGGSNWTQQLLRSFPAGLVWAGLGERLQASWEEACQGPHHPKGWRVALDKSFAIP